MQKLKKRRFAKAEKNLREIEQLIGPYVRKPTQKTVAPKGRWEPSDSEIVKVKSPQIKRRHGVAQVD